MVLLKASILSIVLLPVKGTSDCLSRINHHRAKWGLSPMTERTDLHSCVNREAEYDKAHGAHKAFRWCGEWAQGEGGGHTCNDVIDMFYNERWSCGSSAISGSPYKSVDQPGESQCRKACNDDSGCISFDYVTTSQSDSCRFFKTGAAAEKPDASSGRISCKAGSSPDCSGHCGAVMESGDNLVMSWGEYDGYYTVNYHSDPVVPTMGDQCPSGLAVVRCHHDSSSGILWATGLEGPTCEQTCNLAGAKQTSYQCDSSTKISSYGDVSELLHEFGGFECQPGNCWDGHSPVEFNGAVFSLSSKKCYYPDSSKAYGCDEKLGNANCFGDRFSQLCPCKSEAAQGSDSTPAPAPEALV